MTYLAHLLNMTCLYVLLGTSLNLAVGYGGLLSLCQAAFYGFGAYATALIMIGRGYSFFLAVPLAIALTMIFAIVVGALLTRLRNDSFVLATLAVQSIVSAVLYNWINVTRGPYGISLPQSVTVAGTVLDVPERYALMTIVLTAVTLLMVWRMVNSPFGRSLRAVRDDEQSASALGLQVDRFRSTAFAASGGLAAIPGSLFLGYMTYIDPTSFPLGESIVILTVVILGGAGSFWGPLIGALIVVLAPEALRFLPLSSAATANLRQILYGCLLIGLMRYRRQGVIGEYDFE
jgi:branched-chain amino acid transport system permease protein